MEEPAIAPLHGRAHLEYPVEGLDHVAKVVEHIVKPHRHQYLDDGEMNIVIIQE